MLGSFFFFFLIKLKQKDFQITWANILFTIERNCDDVERRFFTEKGYTFIN